MPSCARTPCCLVFWTSTVGDWPLTVTFSASDPTLTQIPFDRRRKRARELDPFPPHGSEPRKGERDRVGPRPQLGDAVLTGAVRQGRPDLLDQCRAGRFNS